MSFPTHRGRRWRRTAGLRAIARETRLAPDQLVAPCSCTRVSARVSRLPRCRVTID